MPGGLGLVTAESPAITCTGARGGMETGPGTEGTGRGGWPEGPLQDSCVGRGDRNGLLQPAGPSSRNAVGTPEDPAGPLRCPGPPVALTPRDANQPVLGGRQDCHVQVGTPGRVCPRPHLRTERRSALGYGGSPLGGRTPRPAGGGGSPGARRSLQRGGSGSAFPVAGEPQPPPGQAADHSGGRDGHVF